MAASNQNTKYIKYQGINFHPVYYIIQEYASKNFQAHSHITNALQIGNLDIQIHTLTNYTYTKINTSFFFVWKR